MDKSYFSVSFDLILTEAELPYDLYVNSSSLEHKLKFVKIFPEGDEFSAEDLERLKEKYHQLYISEDQRGEYMKSLSKNKNVTDATAVTIIKDSAIKYLHQIFDDTKEFNTDILIETINGCKDAVESMIDVLDDYNIDSLRGLIGSLSGHDFYTYDHSINVSMYCITVLRAVKPEATRNELMHAGLGGLLHDLGKIKIPTNILNKPDGLLESEYQEIKKHPDYGIELLGMEDLHVASDIDLNIISRIVHEHHENWDGTGYPNKLKDKEIHVLARVCCIADFFDAITTKRSYNEVLTIEQALGVMEKTVEKKIDPKIFKAFEAHIKHGNLQNSHHMKLSDSFDPTLPYAKLPLERIKEKAIEDFGKIRVVESKGKKNENQ